MNKINEFGNWDCHELYFVILELCIEDLESYSQFYAKCRD
jgi:hypothetical protein